MTNHNQPPKETEATDTPVSESKRTLIKASATAPLAATLFSGSALATSSLACKGANFNDTETMGYSDNAARVEMTVCIKKVSIPPKYKDNSIYPPRIYITNGKFFTSDGTEILATRQLRKAMNHHYTEKKVWVLRLYRCEPDGSATPLDPWPITQVGENGATALTTSSLTSLTDGFAVNSL